jgi:hypothetical protein
VNGLHLFIANRGTNITANIPVFYSRRYDGPYYRWSYDERMKQWRPSRMHAIQLQELTLCVSKLEQCPVSLKKSLAEHYLE